MKCNYIDKEIKTVTPTVISYKEAQELTVDEVNEASIQWTEGSHQVILYTVNGPKLVSIKDHELVDELLDNLLLSFTKDVEINEEIHSMFGREG